MFGQKQFPVTLIRQNTFWTFLSMGINQRTHTRTQHLHVKQRVLYLLSHVDVQCVDSSNLLHVLADQFESCLLLLKVGPLLLQLVSLLLQLLGHLFVSSCVLEIKTDISFQT